jgi:hypothetical protein
MVTVDRTSIAFGVERSIRWKVASMSPLRTLALMMILVRAEDPPAGPCKRSSGICSSLSGRNAGTRSLSTFASNSLDSVCDRRPTSMERRYEPVTFSRPQSLLHSNVHGID